MLLVSGSIGDKIYTDEQMPWKKVVELFGIDVKIDDKVVIRGHEGTITVGDEVTRSTTHPPSTIIQSQFKGNFKGEPVHIRICVNVTGPADNRRYYYNAQNSIAINYNSAGSPMMELIAADDIEKVVYILLHPWCEGSPVKSFDSKRYEYRRHIQADVQKQRTELSARKAQMIVKVTTATPARRRVYVMGSNAQGHSAYHGFDDEMTCTESILNMIDNDLALVERTWNNSEVVTSGAISEAVFSGNLIVQSHNGERSIILKNGTALCNLSITDTDVSAVLRVMEAMTATERADFIRKDLGFVADDTTAAPVAKAAPKAAAPAATPDAPPVVTEENLQIINDAVRLGILVLDASARIIKVKQQGNLVPFGIDKVAKDKIASWKKDMAAQVIKSNKWNAICEEVVMQTAKD